MNGERDDAVATDDEQESLSSDTLFDVLSGEAIPASPKNALIQKVLRQLVGSYGFRREDIRVGYRLTTRGKRSKTVDIAILRHGHQDARDGQEVRDEHVERVIVCRKQKPREKLRSPQEAAADLRKLHEKLELFPDCRLGMWTNGHEEFFVRVKETTFETRFIDIGAWPAPGEQTEVVLREGGVTQIAADPEDFEAALGRCHQYLPRNILLGADAFKPLGALLLAKIYDEAQPPGERRFWVRGNEPFDPEGKGQLAIRQRVTACFEDAKACRPDLLGHGWDLVHLNETQTARLVTELARYSLTDSLPLTRAAGFRSGVRSTMDGKEGRYPTPLNVARLAVEMLDPGSGDRVMDGSCGTGTFLSMAAVHVFERFLADAGTTPYEATPDQFRDAQARTARWAADCVFGCDMAPMLVVSARLNLLLTAGHPGNIFRIDARTFPGGELDDVNRARDAIPDGIMDVVITNPWFSTKERIEDETILRGYDLAKVWNRTDEGHFVNTGTVNGAGVPPEVLFLERAWRWANPGTGRIAILLPDGLLGNPGDEYVRSWILRHCEVLASIDLPVDPFKVTLKDYRLTPALPSLLVLRRRSDDELVRVTHPDYWVFMATVNRAGVDARGKSLFQRTPDGEELIVEDDIIERIRVGDRIESRTVRRRQRRVDDELPIVSQRYRDFVDGGRRGP